MKYDLIIVAKSNRPELVRLTTNCIASARRDGADMKVIVVETAPVSINYDATVLHYEGPFCYNRALNLGLSKAEGDVHILANNDLIFHEGWSVIGQQMKDNGYDSACALSQDPRQRIYERGDHLYPGFTIGYHVGGWCIFITKEGLKAIGGKLDESFEFWYSDNMYAEQIQKAGLKHALFCNVRIDHITSATLRTIPPREQRKYSFRATQTFNNRGHAT